VPLFVLHNPGVVVVVELLVVAVVVTDHYRLFSHILWLLSSYSMAAYKMLS
jgi:hypothetical protein